MVKHVPASGSRGVKQNVSSAALVSLLCIATLLCMMGGTITYSMHTRDARHLDTVIMSTCLARHFGHAIADY